MAILCLVGPEKGSRARQSTKPSCNLKCLTNLWGSESQWVCLGNLRAWKSIQIAPWYASYKSFICFWHLQVCCVLGAEAASVNLLFHWLWGHTTLENVLYIVHLMHYYCMRTEGIAVKLRSPLESLECWSRHVFQAPECHKLSVLSAKATPAQTIHTRSIAKQTQMLAH